MQEQSSAITHVRDVCLEWKRAEKTAFLTADCLADLTAVYLAVRLAFPTARCSAAPKAGYSVVHLAG